MDGNLEAIALKNEREKTKRGGLTEGGTEREVAPHDSEHSFGLGRWRRQVVVWGRVVGGGSGHYYSRE